MIKIRVESNEKSRREVREKFTNKESKREENNKTLLIYHCKSKSNSNG